MLVEDFYQEIDLLKATKSKKPWSGSHIDKKKKFIYLLDGLCELHFLDKATLIIPEDYRKYKWAQKCYGDCQPQYKKIRLRNFSIITLLHEFKHLLDYNTIGLSKTKKINEWKANYYSTYRFYYIWSEKIKLLDEMFTERKLSVNTENYKINAHLLAIEDLVSGVIRI